MPLNNCSISLFFDGVFPAVAKDMTDIDFQPYTEWSPTGDTLAAIVGVTGAQKGTVQLEMGLTTAEAVAEAMNEGSIEDPTEMMLFLAELANTLCGNAITRMNRAREAGRYWLTPPVAFAGTDLDVTAPNLPAEFLYYTSSVGNVRIKISFEGG